jgi:hypothetical protein
VTLTYVYCIVRSARRPVVPRIAPIPGAAGIRVVAAGAGLWLIVSDVPAAEYGEDSLARGLQDLQWVGSRALAHEAVIERFLNARAVLPMKLFTLFTSDERALSHVTRNARRIERVLARVDRQLEWGVRLTFDESAAASAPAGLRGPRRSALASRETGAAYLSRKKDLRDRTGLQLARARSAGERWYRAIAREATAAHRRKAMEGTARGSRLIVDAAFLVPARRSTAFQAQVRRQARDLTAAGVAVALSGPWPPYNFVNSGSGRSS